MVDGGSDEVRQPFDKDVDWNRRWTLRNVPVDGLDGFHGNV